MRLGIDFGTTRTVIAAADRGNYPLVTFETEDGEGSEWYPGLLAFRGDELRTGFAALQVADDRHWRIFRSIKRCLATAGPEDRIGGWRVQDLVVRFLEDMRQALTDNSNLEVSRADPLEVAVAVPAHSTANQRMITADAFLRAGFDVVRMLDEPSAAGLEYAWRRPADAKVKKRLLVVYDLGGGTFDASFIALNSDVHEVVTTEGLHDLGGDDFDAELLRLACDAIGRPDLAEGEGSHRLLNICRIEKERFRATTRRLVLHLLGDDEGVEVPVADFEAAVRPLIDRSLEAFDSALDRAEEHFGTDMLKHTVIYQVGGSSQLPTVSRVLRERFGRRVWRSPYPHGSVAIGLAIAAEGLHSPRIVERFTRNFGVWREHDHGRAATFDPLFLKDTPLPGPAEPPLEKRRRYRAAHNVAHFRFIESSRLYGNLVPGGEVTPWRDVRFPLVSELRGQPLDSVDVTRLPAPGDEVEERYRCDANGVIEVEMVNLSANYRDRFTLHGVQ
ncbi:MAG: Hsp70 family protein [Pseudomonadota bacterium]